MLPVGIVVLGINDYWIICHHHFNNSVDDIQGVIFVCSHSKVSRIGQLKWGAKLKQ